MTQWQKNWRKFPMSGKIPLLDFAVSVAEHVVPLMRKCVDSMGDGKYNEFQFTDEEDMTMYINTILTQIPNEFLEKELKRRMM